MAAEREREAEREKQEQEGKSKRQREAARSLGTCCRMKMKADEARERNDRSGGVIAIDLTAISTTVSTST